MGFNVALKASIVVQDLTLPAPGLKARNEKDDLQEDQDEYLEVTLTIPKTTLNSTYSLTRVLKLTSAGLNAKSLFIKTSGAISIILVPQGSPVTPYLQPVRSLFVGTFDTDTAPAQIKFINENDDPVTVKIIVGSSN